jgi:hypothetical protein
MEGFGLCSKHLYRERANGNPLVVQLVIGNAEERFWAKVNKDGPLPTHRPDLGPCWIWIGRVTSEGYGTMSVRNRSTYVHRFSYELHVGPIPDGLHIDHLCRNPPCVNPAHLEAVTIRENTMRGDGPRLTRERGRSKTHCKHGHEFTEENTYWHKGHRKCKACFRDRQKVRDARQKAERHARGLKRRPTLRGGHDFCPQGHPLSGDNLYVSPSGHRGCRTCRAERSREANIRRRAARQAAKFAQAPTPSPARP